MTINEIKKALQINETELRTALKQGNLEAIVRLKSQRDELNNCLIQAYEVKLKAA